MSRAVARSAGRTGRIPGEPGIWVLITGDLLIFSIFFLTFAVYHREGAAAYAASQAGLKDMFGLVNTVLLLTGSLFVFRGVTCARDRASRAGAAWLLLGASTGVGFLLSKALEWSHLFLRGISLYTSEFFMFYFMFTGIHAFHVLLGTGVLLHLYSRLRGAPTLAPSLRITEAGGVFWHLVDVLWIVLFALLYLAR